MQDNGQQLGRQYLSFVLEDEQFALDINKVREVLDFKSVTKVPRTPDFMRGVINLRGNVVPVVDLRRKFDMGTTEKTIDTCVIITELQVEDEQVVIGALADSVLEVFDMDPTTVEPPPQIGTRLDTEFIVTLPVRKPVGKPAVGAESFVVQSDIGAATGRLSWLVRDKCRGI